ncbi:MAG: glycosyltransferase [Clostridia bacterium]|nr:glycosyltransferase [Clostridia bacterium]
MKNVILIPAFDPDERLVDLIKALMADGSEYVSDIIVVDDGSNENTHYVFRRLRSIGVRVVERDSNRGKGSALRDGLSLICEAEYDIDGVITADANGKFSCRDIRNVAKAMSENPGMVVVAQRDTSRMGISKWKQIWEKIQSVRLRWSTGENCSDFITGLRGIPASGISVALTTRGENSEYDRNFVFNAAKQGYHISGMMLEKQEESHCGRTFML